MKDPDSNADTDWITTLIYLKNMISDIVSHSMPYIDIFKVCFICCIYNMYLLKVPKYAKVTTQLNMQFIKK